MKILDTPRSGKCGQVVAFQSRYGLCLREFVVPRNTLSEARQHMRGIFGGNSRMWSGRLSQAQRDRWNLAGPQVMSQPQLAQRGPLTGQQFWQSVSSIRSLVGLPPDLEPPAPVVFSPSVVGRLVIEHGADGVRLWLEVSGEPDTDIMVFGQEPCSPGRTKRRNVAYLGLLPPPIGGRSEITQLYRAKYGEPRPGRKVFIVTCQTKNGWKGMGLETNEIVPDRRREGEMGNELHELNGLHGLDEVGAATGKSPGMLAPSAEVASSAQDRQIPYMHKGGTRDAEGIATAVGSALSGSTESGKGDGKGAETGAEGDGAGGGRGNSPGLTGS